MKKILVTGSNGLLGQKLTPLILNSPGFELLATSKGPNRNSIIKGYRYAELDITDENQIEELVAGFRPDVIINTAAITNVDTCHTQRDLCRRINTEAVETLVRICEGHDIHLIHLSTDFVFDGKAGPYTEDAEPAPLSFYGQSKADAENSILSSSCRWTIIRTVLVYGAVRNMSRSNILLWVKSSLEKGDAINVVNDQWRTPTLVEDLAAGCLLAAEKEATGIFHVSGREMMSILEIAERVADFWKLNKNLIRPISSASLNQDAVRPLRTGFIVSKAIKELGYQPHSFEEGLQIAARSIEPGE